ncbi:hypothetical protein Shyhy01_27640 [Streptomyces hygroscopicus subsp. hygroscopicus]|nr:hypothetical protein Shyhy01_27640 [Streptomyces hygroscopicus subsp. hygroscopicus]
MGADCRGTAIPDGRRAGGVRGRGWTGSAGVSAGAVSTVAKGLLRKREGAARAWAGSTDGVSAPPAGPHPAGSSGL